MLQGCQKLRVVEAANRTWPPFAPLCRRTFNKDSAIISRTRYSPYLYNERSNIAKINIHCMPLSAHNWKHQQRPGIIAGLPHSGQSALRRADEVFALRPSVRLYFPFLWFTENRNAVQLQIYWTSAVSQVLWVNDYHYQVLIRKEPVVTK